MRFQSAPGLDIIAPGLIEQAWSETDAFGAATWLWMHADTRRELPLKWLTALLLPAIEHRQFLIACSDARPVAYVSWALFDEPAERRYLHGPPQALQAVDWSSGSRLWFIDWIAPFGHSAELARLLGRQLLAHCWARTLYHRGDERGFTVKTFRGRAVDAAVAADWFLSHPVALDTHSEPSTLVPEGATA